MASYITLSSDDDEIEIICEKRKVDKSIKEEPSDMIIKKLQSSAITLTKIETITVTSPLKTSAVNGEAQSKQASEESDDDVICLDSEEVLPLKNPKTELVLVPSDDEQDVDVSNSNGKVKDGQSNSDVILPESEEDSRDPPYSSSSEVCNISSSDDDVQLLEDDDVSNKRVTSDDEAKNQKPGSSKTQTKPEEGCPSTTSDVVSIETTSNPSKEQEDEFSHDGPGNLTEKLLRQLNVKISEAGFSEENRATVTRKIMKYYSSASEEFTQSPKFVERIKNLISEISKLTALPNSRDIAVLKQISDVIKEFLGEFQRGSTQLSTKLNKLNKMLVKLNRRIQVLETQEVESDDEYENPYIMLDRYRKRAVEVYNKIRQLEGKSNHADRLYLQEFIYSGVGPVPVQRALEKYYNKTKHFPDFPDIYKLVKKVNVEKTLGLTPPQVHMTAEQVFLDFGKKLKRRREYDDFQIARSYLPETQMADPADNDPLLLEKLKQNKALRKTEEEVLRDFAMKEASGEGSSNKEKAESGESSKSEADQSESEKEDEPGTPKKMFMDTDEEMDFFENGLELKRRRSESDEIQSKKVKRDNCDKEQGDNDATKPGEGNVAETGCGKAVEPGVEDATNTGKGDVTEGGSGKTAEPGDKDATNPGKGEAIESGKANVAECGSGKTAEPDDKDATNPGKGEAIGSAKANVAEGGSCKTAEPGVEDATNPRKGEAIESGKANVAEGGSGNTAEPGDKDVTKPGKGAVVEPGDNN